jgi:hypothetical protein
MIKRHFHLIGKTEIEPINFCGKNIGWVLSNKDGIFIPPSEMQPIEGEHNLTTCEGCKKQLSELTNRFTLWIEGKHKEGANPFPYCCEWHKKLLTVKEFNRAYFNTVPEMAAKKVIYTKQLIINKQNSDNWYKEITDYIELTVESFGQMPTGCGAPVYLSDYFFYVTDLLKRYEEIKAEKKTRLLEFLNTYQTLNESPKTDFNILLSTYQKWLKEFPFELNSYFGNLKQHFEKQLPILNGKPEANIYSGLTKAKMHTKSSLIEALINLTNNLLTKINGVTLYEKGLITDANKIKLELVITSRKLKLNQGYTNSSPNEEQRYRKILKKWFKDEKKFIDEITPLLKALPPQQSETKTDKLKAELGKYGFFELTKVKQLSEPNKQSLIELISTNDLPYSIAMFEYLGFLKHLKTEHFTTDYKLFKAVANWFGIAERAVKGNIYVLNEHSKENRTRYTADQQKRTVQKDYEKLK